jgi:hypothetical protein
VEGAGLFSRTINLLTCCTLQYFRVWPSLHLTVAHERKDIETSKLARIIFIAKRCPDQFSDPSVSPADPLDF